MTTENQLRILELFAGIGGLHWALKVAEIPCEIVAAMEINPTVMEIYSHNFPATKVVSKNLQGITAKEINDLGIDAVIMSPPCQPFCRMGKRLDTEDNRTGPLSHITKVLLEVSLKYIFVENVQGFEDSTARDNLLETLTKLNFQWQEFMLTPKAVQVPNSRLRYYLIGKRKDLPWSFQLQPDKLLAEIPNWDDSDAMPFAKLKKQQETENHCRRKRWKELNSKIGKVVEELPFCVGDIIEWDLTKEAEEKLKLANSTLKKYYQAMDIVTPFSTNTCCFTKGYGHFVKGTGSVLKCDVDCDTKDDGIISLRYFSPKEISRLMSYPDQFQFPEKLSIGQKYRSLGNSVNVYVVAILFSLLFSEK